MGYYISGPPFTNIATVPAMLSAQSIADGQCAAWVELLEACLTTHGISSAQMVLVQHIGQIPPPYQWALLVRNYEKDPTTLPNDTFLLVGTPSSPQQLNPASGIPGQLSPDPKSYFAQHFLLKYGNQFYDPSYGKGPFSASVAWEDVAVAALGKLAQSSPWQGAYRTNGQNYFTYFVLP